MCLEALLINSKDLVDAALHSSLVLRTNFVAPCVALQYMNLYYHRHFCYAYGFAELGQYLISKGGDPTIQNNAGYVCYNGISG
jgi:hypothetical protein